MLFGRKKEIEELPDDDMDAAFKDAKPNWKVRTKIAKPEEPQQ